MLRSVNQTEHTNRKNYLVQGQNLLRCYCLAAVDDAVALGRAIHKMDTSGHRANPELIAVRGRVALHLLSCSNPPSAWPSSPVCSPHTISGALPPRSPLSTTPAHYYLADHRSGDDLALTVSSDAIAT